MRRICLTRSSMGGFSLPRIARRRHLRCSQNGGDLGGFEGFFDVVVAYETPAKERDAARLRRDDGASVDNRTLPRLEPARSIGRLGPRDDERLVADERPGAGVRRGGANA